MGFGSFVKKAFNGVKKVVSGAKNVVSKVTGGKIGSLASLGYNLYTGNYMGALSSAAGAAGSGDTGDPGQSTIGKIWNGVTTGLNAFAPYVTGYLGYKGAQSANASSAQSVREQMAFQEAMRNTQYQAGMADMKKAGLNPMLAYSNGGAAAPSGASMQYQNEMGQGISSAQAARSVQATVENLGAQTQAAQAQATQALATAKNQMSQSAYTDSQTAAQTAEAYADQLRSQTSLNGWQINQVQAQTKKIGQDLHLSAAETELALARVNNAILEGSNIIAMTENTKVNTALTRVQTQMQRYQMNAAVNMSDAQATWWKQNIAPYLQDVMGVTSSARDLNALRPNKPIGKPGIQLKH